MQKNAAEQCDKPYRKPSFRGPHQGVNIEEIFGCGPFLASRGVPCRLRCDKFDTGIKRRQDNTIFTRCGFLEIENHGQKQNLGAWQCGNNTHVEHQTA
jgi:hypothetical protein